MKSIHAFLMLAALLGLLAAAGCSGGASGSVMGDRDSTATAGSPFVTELIAGAGQGWPATGEDAGKVSIWNDGTYLYVKYNAEGSWYFGEDGSLAESLHLYVGDTKPTTTAPGQFPFKSPALDGATEYTFQLPLVNGSHNWTGDNLYIAAHAGVCITEGGDPGGIDLGIAQGVFLTTNLYLGSTFIDIGSVTWSIVGTNLVVDIDVDPGYAVTDSHLYVDPTTPPILPFGGWPYGFSSPEFDASTYTYTVPLADISADCGTFLYYGVHVHVDPDGSDPNIVGGTALGWEAGCATPLELPNGGGPHQFFKYCDLTLPDCVTTPPIPGTERCETAWGLDPVNGNDGISKNEPGWFETFFNSNKKPWGWVFRYQVTP